MLSTQTAADTRRLFDKLIELALDCQEKLTQNQFESITLLIESFRPIQTLVNEDFVAIVNQSIGAAEKPQEPPVKDEFAAEKQNSFNPEEVPQPIPIHEPESFQLEFLNCNDPPAIVTGEDGTTFVRYTTFSDIDTSGLHLEYFNQN